MQLLRRGRRLLGSRLAWRLLAVFIAAALLPLALSDWLATAAIGDLSLKLYHGHRLEATRDVSRQVFDRLIMAKTLMRGVAQSGATGTEFARGPSADNAGSPFVSLRCGAHDAMDPATALETAWAQAAASTGAAATPAATALRVLAAPPGQPARVLLSAQAATGHRCLAELDGAWLWSPVHDASDETAWRVRVDGGPDLLAIRSLDPASAAPQTDLFNAHLFLGAEFAAPSWTFEQSSAAPPITWHGQPIVSWLTSVALATLLGIALVGHWTLRRTLEPLRQLTAGSRSLAAGAAPDPVDVRRHDELGELASSFNEMATQLQSRIAALRGLAGIAAGILGAAAFAQLAAGVLARLAAVHPDIAIAVTWREDEASLLRLRCDGNGLPTRVALDAAREAFDRAVDGRVAVDAALSRLAGEAPGAGAMLELLTIRDGHRNQALISLRLPSADATIDLAQSIELRDRLSVAIIARNRLAELEHRASHDALTGLRNASGLQAALDAALSRDEPLAVLFIDLDHFKDVNDCYGHAVGDRLLQAAARRLARLAPAPGVLSRNGGDEFVLAIPATDAAQAAALADRIVAEFAKAFVLSGMELACGASIGIALSPQHGTDRVELMRCADIALYESKNNGRGRHTRFASAYDTALRERNDLLAGLVRGLARSEFVLHYQPRLDARTRAITSAEALVRWQHPDRGLVMPGVFIELAESSGLIDALGSLVLESAIAQMAQWQRDGLAVARVSVNVSQRQFASGALVPHVRDLLARHDVRGARLEIEVTESLMGGDMAGVRAQLLELRSMGVTIAMDDFGTGYSSMALLRGLPIDVMKIDRAFVKDLDTDPDAVAIAQTIVTLARALGLTIVAEGIETEAQAARLGAMGCDEFQGFLFARAMSAQAFAAFDGVAAPTPTP
ncbi:MAG: EAL domain-containing protein [Betaproteobacteria bacterium]